eukprot:TRINITY_DN8711_c0_g1_i2.p1 TRINITY_DN8711_c0_g1~~TRINITY_DN8711_c0_g1_i2.p1  ORF type:complete len:217 (-),score=64.25 TRINITY_DN8711_c0_g1_i2:976-1626(-)
MKGFGKGKKSAEDGDAPIGPLRQSEAIDQQQQQHRNHQKGRKGKSTTTFSFKKTSSNNGNNQDPKSKYPFKKRFAASSTRPEGAAGSGKPVFVKGKRRDCVINFNEDNRKEFLTGFRKRKNARRAIGKKIAEEKARELKREERKKRRAVYKERMDELDRVEEYFRLVTCGAVSVDGNEDDESTLPKAVTYQDVQTTEDGEEFEVEVTTSMTLPDAC